MVAAVQSKVQLRGIFFDEILHEQTMSYWLLSSAWNGRGPGAVTIMDAMYSASSIMKIVGPQRKLHILVSNLQGDLVEFGSKRVKNKKLKLKPSNQNTPTKVHVL